MKVQPLTIVCSRISGQSDTEKREFYTSDVVLEKPHPDANTVDLSDYRIFPAIINAHDHLELNHYPRSKFRERYDNAHEWGEDMNARLNQSPYLELRAYPLEDRLFIGGLKNLLCGALTVAHHNPPHKALFRQDFPVRVLRNYGWSHSLHFSTDSEIVRSYRSTPPDLPWFIHLAEGTDRVASSEYQRLKALGCVGKNTVIVHGIGMTNEDIADAAKRVCGLVVCPTTNVFLLDAKPDIGAWRCRGVDVAFGSDSRLTAIGDLLREIIMGRHCGGCDADCASQAVTNRAASILGLKDVGQLNPSARADWTLGNSLRRAEISLIVRGGVPQIGDSDVMARFPNIKTVACTLDGVPKLMNIKLARQVAACSLKEPGLVLDEIPQRRKWF